MSIGTDGRCRWGRTFKILARQDDDEVDIDTSPRGYSSFPLDHLESMREWIRVSTLATAPGKEHHRPRDRQTSHDDGCSDRESTTNLHHRHTLGGESRACPERSCHGCERGEAMDRRGERRGGHRTLGEDVFGFFASYTVGLRVRVGQLLRRKTCRTTHGKERRNQDVSFFRRRDLEVVDCMSRMISVAGPQRTWSTHNYSPTPHKSRGGCPSSVRPQACPARPPSPPYLLLSA